MDGNDIGPYSSTARISPCHGEGDGSTPSEAEKECLLNGHLNTLPKNRIDDFNWDCMKCGAKIRRVDYTCPKGHKLEEFEGSLYCDTCGEP